MAAKRLFDRRHFEVAEIGRSVSLTLGDHFMTRESVMAWGRVVTWGRVATPRRGVALQSVVARGFTAARDFFGLCPCRGPCRFTALRPMFELAGEVFGKDRVGIAENRGMFDGIGQFANISGPVVSDQQRACFGAEELFVPTRVFADFAEQVRRQRKNIAGSFAEGWNVDLKGVDAEEEVLAKRPLADHCFQIAVCGTDDADIDLGDLWVSDAADLASFEDAEQFRLHGEGKFADFIEEDRSVVGHFEQSHPRRIGTGKGPAAMPEEFAFDEIFGERAAVHGEKRLVGAKALLVHGAGHEFLPATCFAANQHGAFGGRDFRDQLTDMFDPRVRSDQVASPFGATDAMFEGCQLAADRSLLGDATENGRQIGQTARFGEVFERSVPKRGDGGFLARFSRDHHRFDRRMELLGKLDHLDPMEAGHIEIDQEAVKGLSLERSDRRQTIRTDSDRMPHPWQFASHHLLESRFVIGEEDRELVGVRRR